MSIHVCLPMNVPVVYLQRLHYSPSSFLRHTLTEPAAHQLLDWLVSKILGSCHLPPCVRWQAQTVILGFWLDAQSSDLDPHARVANNYPLSHSPGQSTLTDFYTHIIDEKVEISQLVLSLSSWMTWENHCPFEAYQSLHFSKMKVDTRQPVELYHNHGKNTFSVWTGRWLPGLLWE